MTLFHESSMYPSSLSKHGLLFAKLCECVEDPGNEQLASFRGDMKHLTSLPSIPNIALKTANFYSASVLLNFMTFYTRIKTLVL